MSSALHIHIGGAGVMIGDMLWKLYEAEHNETTQKNYIYKQVDGNHHPYTLFADLDDRMTHEVQRNTEIQFKKNSFLQAKNYEGGLTYARALYGPGKEKVAQDFIQFIQMQSNKHNSIYLQIEFIFTSFCLSSSQSAILQLQSTTNYQEFKLIRASDINDDTSYFYQYIYDKELRLQRDTGIG